jgi:hypothetical protein
MTKAVPACSPAYGRPRRSSPEYPDEVVRARLALVIVPKTVATLLVALSGFAVYKRTGTRGASR